MLKPCKHNMLCVCRRFSTSVKIIDIMPKNCFKNFLKSDEKELTSGSRSGKISRQIERGAAEKAATRKTLKRKRKNILKKV